MRPRLVAAALLAGAVTAGCFGGTERSGPQPFIQRPDSRLIKVQSVGLAAFGPVNPHTAPPSLLEDAFGEPSEVRAAHETCRRRWDSLGLEIRFESGGPGYPCDDEGRITSIVLAGEAAAGEGWRTAEGIRPLQRVDAVERIYPEVGAIRAGTVALVEPPSEVPGPPVLVVEIARGKVRTMTFPLGTG
jgi:hypothetical protein